MKRRRARSYRDLAGMYWLMAEGAALAATRMGLVGVTLSFALWLLGIGWWILLFFLSGGVLLTGAALVVYFEFKMGSPYTAAPHLMFKNQDEAEQEW